MAFIHASVGDEIVVDPLHIDEPARRGEILEVLVNNDVTHYRGPLGRQRPRNNLLPG